MKSTLRAAVVLLLVLGATLVIWWYVRQADATIVAFKTAAVKRDTLTVTIDASGTLEPEEVVDVGAQVAGQIVSFGLDVSQRPIDYGSHIEQGTVLARIDEALFQADVTQADAQLAAAKAGVARAQAEVAQLQARLGQAQREWDRAQRLLPAQAISQAACDAAQYAWEIAVANLAVGQASFKQSEAAVAQAENALWRAKRNLGYCTITAPVTGVVIDRRVNIGQTVVASLNAPSLFLIARDLRRMQVWVAVNEADITRIHTGQPVTFTVDALPDEHFTGLVVRRRLNASMTQNVVTYIVEIATDNTAGRLLPYLTANVRFEVSRRDNVLLAPSAALRWTPTADQIDAGASAPATLASTHAAASAASRPATQPAARQGTVYTPHGAKVRAIPVRIGLSNGAYTEIEGPGITEGLLLVTGTETVAATQTGTATTDAGNPFTPKLPAPPRGMGPPR